MAGFLVTAVLLPVLGVVVVARFDGLEPLGWPLRRLPLYSADFGWVWTAVAMPVCARILHGLSGIRRGRGQ